MRNPSKKSPLKKSGPGRRPALLIFLVLVILGLIGFGFLQVFQLEGQSGQEQAIYEKSENIQSGISPAAAGGRFSINEPNAEKISTSRDETPGKENSGPESQTSRTDENSAAETPPEDREGLVISGAVMDDSGDLLPDIPVRARPANLAGANQDLATSGNNELTEITDPMGSFTFDNLLEGEYQLAVDENEQYFASALRVRAGMSNAELVLQRIRSIRVYGVITDEAGNPLEGVRVRMLGSTLQVRSDVSGAYSIQTGPSKAGQAPVIDFSLKEYRRSRQRVETAMDSEADEVELNVKMEPESDAQRVAITGLVSGPRGEPVSGARIWLSSTRLQTYEETTSRESSEYRFENVEVGDAYLLGVEPMGEYAAFRSGLLSVGPGDLYYDVVLDTAGFSNLSGTVTDLSGSPLGHFTFWVRNIDVASHSLIPVQTDGAGGFRLEAIPAGSIQLISRSQPWLEASGIVLQPGESRHVVLPLDWGQDWLLGQVVDDEDNPVSRANVVLRWTQNYTDVISKSRRQVMSDQGGYFVLSNLDAKVYTLTIQAAGHKSVSIQYQLDQSGPEVTIKLPRLASKAQVTNEGN